MATCIIPPGNRRRLFWATQPDVCGDGDTACGYACGNPALVLTDDGTVSTNEWLRGLIINMLMTEGRRDPSACGNAPGAQGGHWSESFMDGDNVVGTQIRHIETAGRTNELIQLLSAYIKATLERLVSRGLATSVEVDVKYVGNGKFEVAALVYGVSGTNARVNLSTTRSANAWIWENQ